MGFELDAKVVRHKINELFKIGHERHDFVHGLHEQHSLGDAEWKECGPVMVHHVDDKTKLIRFEFDNQFDAVPDGPEKKLEERLAYIQRFLASVVEPGEEYHLTVEERPNVNDPARPNLVTYFIRGVVVPKGA